MMTVAFRHRHQLRISQHMPGYLVGLTIKWLSRWLTGSYQEERCDVLDGHGRKA